MREALTEREVLLRQAPHIIAPMRFVLPHHKGLRPRWLIRLGLFLYDHLGGRKILEKSKSLDLTKDIAGKALKDSFTRGFEYSDCTVDDSRLTVLAAIDARQHGADIKTCTRLTAATPEGNHWQLTLEDTSTGNTIATECRVLVNAAGPWVSEVTKNRIHTHSKSGARLVKGSHIVVPAIFDHKKSYIFQNDDDRIVFAIPYQGKYTLIGTTDVDVKGDFNDRQITEAEIDYLCHAVNVYFKSRITRDDIVWSFAGIRPLYDDGATAAQEATRDYVLELSGDVDNPVLLSVFGGKITTFRHLAEDALDRLSPFLENPGPAWTVNSTLPGGDFAHDGIDRLITSISAKHSYLPRELADRLAHTYGTNSFQLLDGCTSIDDLGILFADNLYQREVDYLITHEWARTSTDILFRRTKLGIDFPDEAKTRLEAYLTKQ